MLLDSNGATWICTTSNGGAYLSGFGLAQAAWEHILDPTHFFCPFFYYTPGN